MTPERRQEIRDLASLPESSFRPLFPSATVLELLADNDAQAAEIAALKAEVERLTTDADKAEAIYERDSQRAYDAGYHDGYREGYRDGEVNRQ